MICCESSCLAATCKALAAPRQANNLHYRAQTKEQDLFLTLLHDLCRPIPTPAGGRTRQTDHAPIRHDLPRRVQGLQYVLWSSIHERATRVTTMRIYCPRPALQFNLQLPTDLENDFLTPVLMDLIIQSSLPLKSVESNFACDSSGFSTARFERWYDYKYGQARFRHE